MVSWIYEYKSLNNINFVTESLKLQEKNLPICKKYIKKIKISCLITNLTEPKIT